MWKNRPHEALRLVDPRERLEVGALAVGEKILRDQEGAVKQRARGREGRG
jgi:hypothetical protein